MAPDLMPSRNVSAMQRLPAEPPHNGGSREGNKKGRSTPWRKDLIPRLSILLLQISPPPDPHTHTYTQAHGLYWLWESFIHSPCLTQNLSWTFRSNPAHNFCLCLHFLWKCGSALPFADTRVLREHALAACAPFEQRQTVEKQRKQTSSLTLLPFKGPLKPKRSPSCISNASGDLFRGRLKIKLAWISQPKREMQLMQERNSQQEVTQPFKRHILSCCLNGYYWSQLLFWKSNIIFIMQLEPILSSFIYISKQVQTVWEWKRKGGNSRWGPQQC